MKCLNKTVYTASRQEIVVAFNLYGQTADREDANRPATYSYHQAEYSTTKWRTVIQRKFFLWFCVQPDDSYTWPKYLAGLRTDKAVLRL